jgi:hypothetical protein
MPRFEPVVSRQARGATLARVAPRLAHVRAEGGSWSHGALGQKQKSPPRRMPGGQIGEEPDATWY